MSPAEFLDERVAPLLALKRFDEPWAATLSASSFFSLWIKLKSAVQKALPSCRVLGKFCESLSFLLTMLLFLVLPAPQFAEDKGLLALLVLFAFALRTVGIILDGENKYRPTAVDVLVLSFAAVNVIATAASHYLLPSIRGLSKMGVYFCSYFLFAGVLQKSPRSRSLWLIAALLAAGFLESCYGIDQFRRGVAPLATWEDPSIEDKTTRVYGHLKNPNLLAGYLLPLIPLSLASSFSFFSESGWKKIPGILLICVCAAISLCCIYTGSRGAYMGIAAGLIAMGFVLLSSLWSARPKLRPLLLVAVLLSPVLLAFLIHHFPSYEHRILSIFHGSEHSSNAYRMNVYRASIKMFLDSWWIGVGPGNTTFKLAYGLYMKSGFDALGTYCVPLEVAVETGIVGLLIFAAMLVSAFARAHLNFWKNSKIPQHWISAGAAAGLLGMMVHGLVDTVYYRPQVQFVFWLLLALCVYANAADKNVSDLSESSAVKGKQQ